MKPSIAYSIYYFGVVVLRWDLRCKFFLEDMLFSSFKMKLIIDGIFSYQAAKYFFLYFIRILIW